jgi:hypothetical protein
LLIKIGHFLSRPILSAKGAMMNTNNNLPRALTSRLRRQLRSVLGTLALLFSLGAAQSALATVTVLTFDELSPGTDLTTQYESLGVTVTTNGVTVILNADVIGIPLFSAPNVVFGLGVTSFSLNSAITDDIYTVSAYVTPGPTVDVGLFAFDIGNNLLGQVLLPENAAPNTLLSFTSSGNSIAFFQINSESSYLFDNLTFATRSTVPEPPSAWLMGVGLLGMLVATRRRNATTHAG